MEKGKIIILGIIALPLAIGMIMYMNGQQIHAILEDAHKKAERLYNEGDYLNSFKLAKMAYEKMGRSYDWYTYVGETIGKRAFRKGDFLSLLIANSANLARDNVDRPVESKEWIAAYKTYNLEYWMRRYKDNEFTTQARHIMDRIIPCAEAAQKIESEPEQALKILETVPETFSGYEWARRLNFIKHNMIYQCYMSLFEKTKKPHYLKYAIGAIDNALNNIKDEEMMELKNTLRTRYETYITEAELRKNEDKSPAIQYETGGYEDLLEQGKKAGREKNFEAAVRFFRSAIFKKQDSVEAHYLLGVALMKLNRLSEARDAFGTVLQLSPEHREAKKYYEEISSKIDRKIPKNPY